LLKQVKVDWNSIEDNNEIKILEKYAIENRLVSLIFVFTAAFSLCFFIIVELIPVILDAAMPMNTSRLRKVKIDFEFFIDEKQYFYIYFIYEIITLLIGMFTVLATGSLSLAFLRHCCATFKIARFSTFFMNIMNKWYSAIMLISVISLSCSLFRLKQLLEQIQDDWNSLKDKLEINIIEKYACNARLFTIILIVYCYFGLIFCGIFQFLPMILDVILPLNDSRPCKLFVVTEYFVNQEKYFYVMLLHETLAYIVGTATLCSTSATIMTCILHTCALFKIARFAELLTSSFAVLFFILIIIGVSSLSFNLFQFLQLITFTKNINQAFIVATLIFLHLNYMFVANYGGQELLNHGLKLFKATYNGLWYAAPLRTQKLLLFIMQKGTINVSLTCGGIFVASLEGFATVKLRLL
ncbi:hypothetical protein G5I_10346, partial [Acromyrmex echinatior]